MRDPKLSRFSLTDCCTRRGFQISALSLALTMAAPLEAQNDPWTPEDLLTPKQVADMLARHHPKLKIVYVGFPMLYRAAHIPGAIPAGPASKPDGLEKLTAAVRAFPADSEVVLYCGCCPLKQCPNIRPAYQQLHGMKSSNLRVLVIETNLHTDWIQKGYPVEKSSGS
jgi:hypothetical protein